MEGKYKSFIGEFIMSFLLIAAGIIIAAVTSSTIVRICGVAVAVIEVFSVLRRLIKSRTGGGNKE